MKLNFAKVEFYTIQWNAELEFEKIEFQVWHISLNCIELNFGEIKVYFKLDFEKAKHLITE